MEKKLKNTNKNNFDIVIVGAGPAGIFATLELIKTNPKLKIALIDMGRKIEDRGKGEVMSGFGGAGTYSDGKIHYSPVLSHERALHLISIDGYQKILDEIKETFALYGVNSKIYPNSDDKEVFKLIEEAQKNDVEPVVRTIQHIGTDKLSQIIKQMQSYILENKVSLFTKVKIVKPLIEKEQCVGVEDSKGKRFLAKKTLFCPGRVGAMWLKELGDKYNIKYQFDMVEVGVRVEFLESIMKRHADVFYEVIFKIRTKTYDDIVRTFCPCPNGFVAIETYKNFVCVNGHSDSDHTSKNSNFAFVVEVHLTEPVENSIQYAESVAQLANTIGGGKPILQRLEDLRKGRRSTWVRLNKSTVTPSLKEVTPGDISMALPHRVVTDIIEGLEKLDRVLPGINSGSTLLYAPEVKFRSSKVATDENMQTTVKNLYVAGDASGLSGSITGAAATGIMAARGMVQSLKLKVKS